MIDSGIVDGAQDARDASVDAPPIDAGCAWTRLGANGTPPTPRSAASAIYDSANDRMIVFGGADSVGRQADVHALALAGSPAWSAPAIGGVAPGEREAHAAVYDSGGQKMAIFGGQNSFQINDSYSLTLPPTGTMTWTLLSGTSAPPGRYNHTAIFHNSPPRKMVVFGGLAGSPVRQNDINFLTLAATPAWSGAQAVSGTMEIRDGHTSIYDRANGRMVVFGGAGQIYYQDVHYLAFAPTLAWSLQAPTGTKPVARFSHTAIYDSPRQRMILYGGLNSNFSPLDDVWSLTLPTSETPAWSRITPMGTPPAPRFGHTAVYDESGERLIIFGGQKKEGMNPIERTSEVWILPLTWCQ